MFNYHLTIVSSIFLIFIVIFILWRGFRIYITATGKQSVFKMIIFFFVGSLITGQITQSIGGINYQIPILPVGVWLIALFVDKQKTWPIYRSYAWLGFILTILLTINTIVSYPIQKFLYSPKELANYIHTIDNSTIFITHLSGHNDVELTKDALNFIHTATYDNNYYSWIFDEYNNSYENPKAKEKFPYLLLNTKSKFGSGYHPYIFIESNGKGILILDKTNSSYFQLDSSILSGVK